MICGELVEQTLRVCGVDAVYGQELHGVRVTVVRETAMGNLLALAHEGVHRRSAMVHVGDGVLVRPRWTGPGTSVVLESPEDIVALGETAGDIDGLRELRLDVDLTMPVNEVAPQSPISPTTWAAPEESLVERIQSSVRPVVIAGPGVVAAGAQASLHAFAVAASVGVLNTWGAKGLFH